MKSHRNPTRPRLARMALCIALALGGPLVGLPGMAQVSISEVPLINADVSVKPNLMFILDNSGSMDFDYLPDSLDDRQNQWDEVSRRDRYGHWSSHCNGAAFNPDSEAVDYERPVTPDGRRYPNMSPTAAWSDGFIPATVSNSSYNVTTSINTETPDPDRAVADGGPVTLDVSVSIYDGSYSYSVGHPIVFYQRIDSSTTDRTHFVVGSVTAVATSGKYKTYTIRLTFSSFRNGTIANWVMGRVSTVDLTSTSNSPRTDYYYTYSPLSNSPKAMSWAYDSNGTLNWSDTFVAECMSEIGTAPGSDRFTQRFIGDLPTASDKVRYANWYSYYRKRILMMRSAAGRTMASLNDDYRVGFSSLNKDGAFNTTVTNDLRYFMDVGDFTTSHKLTFFSNLYGSPVGNSTPLRRALAKVGRYYGNRFTGQTDPMQHACQRNYSLLTTDGYWNESTNPTQLDGSTAIGNQDGNINTSPRPEYDNSQNYTAVYQRTNYKEGSSSGCFSGRKRYIPYTETRTLTSTTDGSTYSDWAAVPGSDGSATSCRSSAPGASSATLISQVGGPALNTLADVAAYYYKTDLRSDLIDTVPYSDSDPNRKQHMTTYTLGLGLSGQLSFDEDYYKDSTSSPTYQGLKAGTVNWPIPSADKPSTIDDLWHAAINGHGIYYSANNASNLSKSLSKALKSISERNGAGASAASTSLRPVLGTDQVFVASYTTIFWTGELEARTFKLNSDDTISVGAENRDWKASGALTSREYTGRTIYYMRKQTTGTGPTAVTALSMGNFDHATLSTDVDGTDLTAHFANYCSKVPQPSQCTTLSTAQKTSAGGANLVNFLRGDRSNENTLYRARESVLGDMVDASPVYVGKPPFLYTGNGYPDYATQKRDRCPVVYAAANDGMLHAFSAKSTRTEHAGCPDAGQEMWAYVPRAVMSRMYMLADANYEIHHRFFVNASPIVGDVATRDGDTTTWRTILVGGLGAGGNAYYALDVTNPRSPLPLWEFSDGDLGKSYSNPIITQVPDAAGDLVWAVVFTSGVNNGGNGYLYVLNAVTGAVIHKVPTLLNGNAVGTSTAPSGLNKLNAWISQPSDNVASRFYAGDMLGNLWRFDANNLTAPTGSNPDTRAVRLAQFLDGSTPQAITTRPEVAEVKYGGASHAVVLVGTGRYLGGADVLDTTTTHSIYGVKDPLTSTGWGNVRASMIEQTATTVLTDHDDDPDTPAIETKSGSRNTVNWSNSEVAGWYIDLTSPGERVAVGMSLAYTTLTVASVVPANDACTGSGYSWIYDLDIATGSYVLSQAAGQTIGYKSSVAIMGINTLQFDGRAKSSQIITKADGSIEIRDGSEAPTASGALRRTAWRELTP